ncbi:MAG: lysophospholipid acyltransferase family protein [Gammaproteobacteria bacterium]|jgi:1-acyl-sn-glycerol-3-phosphate acyltransferase
MVAFLGRTIWLLWCWIELAVFTLLLYVLAWMPRVLTRPYYHNLFRVWCAFFVRALGVDLRLHEKNREPLPEQFILIANHPSALEDVGIPMLFDVYPLAKYEVKSWWLVGRINVAAGTLFVKREVPESRHQALEAMLEKLQQGDNLAIFPEGGCKGRRIYTSFQSGAFDLSLRTGLPLLPVFLHYEAQETFEWRHPQTLLHKMWHFMTSRNDQANYYVYDAIYPEEFTDKKAYAEWVRQMYLRWQERYLE